MALSRIYLDHNASSPLRPEARAAMSAALECAGNPSSVHAEGRAARAVVERARESVARLANVAPADVVFTSGGSEAANAVVRSGYDVVVLSALEHPCVRAAAVAAGARIVEVPVTPDGTFDVGALEPALARIDTSRARTLVCVQAANNETGVVQPVAEVAARARGRADVFVDAVQAAGRVPVDPAAWGVDAIALSAHKLGGPKGVGAIVTSGGYRPVALVVGGGQERGARGGTENVVGIAGFGAAAEAALAGLAGIARQARRRDEFEVRLREIAPDAIVVGAAVERLANTTCVVVPGGTSETLVIRFDLAGVAVSAGAACSSGKVARSPVLEAMGLDATLARGAIRVSQGWTTTDSDLEGFLTAWQTIAAARREPRAVA